MEETGGDGSEREEDVIVRGKSLRVLSVGWRNVSKIISIHWTSAMHVRCPLAILWALWASYVYYLSP